MRIEIDQSGKIEDTSKHTYLAFSNSQHYVVKISSVEKRKLQKYFRLIGKPKLYVYITFATLIVILLEHLESKSNQIIIDIEYPGRSNLIKDLLRSLNAKVQIKDISFHEIGKKSRAHYLAKGTAINKLKSDLAINAEQLLKIIKKSGSA